MDTIKEYAPTIIGAIADILSNMLDGIINSLPQILDTLNVVVEKLAEVLPQLIQKLIDLFIGILQNPEKIAQLVVTIIKGIVEIFNVLLRNIGPLLEALLPAIGTIIIELIKAIPDILASMAEALWEAVKGIGKFIVNMIIDVLNLLFDGISKAWTWIPGTKGIPHIPKLATGTDNAQRGIALVGEAGPELVRFNGGEQVLNNRHTQKALAGIGSGGNTFNVTFNNTMDTTAYAMMSQLRQYNRQMAINSII
jgi:phage-related protein